MDRNAFVDGDWLFKQVDNTAICKSFDCGDSDLNEYFRVDAIQYKEELLTQTYCLQTIHPPNIQSLLLTSTYAKTYIKRLNVYYSID